MTGAGRPSDREKALTRQAEDYLKVIYEIEQGGTAAATTDIAHLEARQTILEGQTLLSSAVERIPDVRRGDSVRVQLVSNGIMLSIAATLMYRIPTKLPLDAYQYVLAHLARVAETAAWKSTEPQKLG